MFNALWITVWIILLNFMVAVAQPYPEMASGVIIGVDAKEILIQTSPGKQMIVDITAAKAGDHIGSPIKEGLPVVVQGWHNKDGKFMAAAVHKGRPAKIDGPGEGK